MLKNIAIPIMPSRNLDETLSFYRELGFEVIGRQRAPYPYAIVRRAEIELHFFEHPTVVPQTSMAGCYIRVDDADLLYEVCSQLSLERVGIPRMGVIEDKPWGMREFHIVDPNGNLLRIGHSTNHV